MCLGWNDLDKFINYILRFEVKEDDEMKNLGLHNRFMKVVNLLVKKKVKTI